MGWASLTWQLYLARSPDETIHYPRLLIYLSFVDVVSPVLLPFPPPSHLSVAWWKNGCTWNPHVNQTSRYVLPCLLCPSLRCGLCCLSPDSSIVRCRYDFHILCSRCSTMVGRGKYWALAFLISARREAFLGLGVGILVRHGHCRNGVVESHLSHPDDGWASDAWCILSNQGWATCMHTFEPRLSYMHNLFTVTM